MIEDADSGRCQLLMSWYNAAKLQPYAWSSMSPDWRFVGFGNYAECSATRFSGRRLSTTSSIRRVGDLPGRRRLGLAAVLQAGVFGPHLRSLFRTTLFLPSILPVTVVGLLWQLIYQPTIGLIDQLLFS